MIMLMLLQRKSASGFTIVELIVVIIVIAILAAIVTVAFNGVRKNSTASSMKSSLSSIAQKFKTEHVDDDIYPTTLSSTIKMAPRTGVALAEVASTNQFCINITHLDYSDLQWHMTQDLQVLDGLCSGNVIVASIIGEYNQGASPALSPIVTAQGDNGGFTVTTAADWSTIDTTWTAVSGASRYEIQISTDNGANWYLRRLADDDARPNGAVSTYQTDVAFSAQIPNSSTSNTWHGPNAIPKTVGQVYKYRFRSYNGSGVASGWSTATLAAPTDATTSGQITNITAAPATSFDTVTLNWTSPSSTNIPSPYIEIQLRNVADGVWYLRRILDTSANSNAPVASYQTDPAFSAYIPLSQQSQTWHGSYAVPQTNGATYEYRMRLRSDVISGLTKDWSTPVQVSVPAYNAITGFSGVAAGSGTASTITLSWNTPTGATPPSMAYEIQLRNLSDGVWYLRRLVDSSSNSNAPVSGYQTDTAFSAFVPSNSNSIVWHGTYPTPQTGQTFEYQIRQKSNTLSGLYSGWTTVQVAR